MPELRLRQKEEAMGAKLEDGVLTLTYVDGVEVYTKK